MTNTADPPIHFGEWVNKRRKHLDLTQIELADRAGCSVHAIRKIESGERRPSKQLAELLARSLDVSHEDHIVFIRVARGELNIERLASPALERPDVDSNQSVPSAVNIPLSPYPLVGRESELAALEKKFADPQCRLLTLTGLGGIGKTRLAIEFANQQMSRFLGGVYYVPLTAITAPRFIIQAIAEALKITFSGPADPKDQLYNHLSKLGELPALLVLDNMEHLLVSNSPDHDVPESVELVAEMLQQFPNLKILVTSRERLNLHGEWIFELHGLRVPPEELPEKFNTYSAVHFFIQTARRVNTGFELDHSQEAALIRICNTLEGIPLALELAAAWTGILSIEEIENEIDQNLSFLSTSIYDIPDRHRSLRATFEHSWKLLNQHEKTALSKFTVFRGGFTRAAAEEITGASLPLLASLLAKSLIHRSENGRYDLHEVIRQFASKYLDEDPQCSTTCNAHSRYYLSFVKEAESSLKSSAQQAAFRQLLEEIDNIRTAWNWAIHQGDFAIIDDAARSLGWFFEVGGLLTEGVDYFDKMMKLLQEANNQQWQGLLGKVLAYQSLLLFRKGLFSKAQARLEQSIGILRSVGDEVLLIDPLVYLGVIMHLHGNLPLSKNLLQEACTYAQASGDEWFEAYAIFNLGYVDSLQGKFEEGFERMQLGMQIWQRLGDPHSLSLGFNFLTPTLVKLKRFEEAKTGLQVSLSLSLQTRNRWGMGTAYRYLGLVYLAEGNQIEAQLHLTKSMEIFSEFVIGWDIARTLSYMGDSHLLMGEIEKAEKYYLDALKIAVEAKSGPIVLDAFLGMAQVYFRRKDRLGALKIATFILNNTKTLQAEIESLDEILEETMVQLTGQEIENANKWALKMTKETIAKKILAGDEI